MKKLLITGFDPFGGEAINPSWEAVQLLPDDIGSFQLTKLQLPTVFSLASEAVITAADTLQPDAILAIGQAGGRTGITPEMVGINLRNASIADNQGQRPVLEAIVPGAPDGYFSRIPAPAMVEAMRKAGLPAALSYSAGAFVCNDVLYSLLHHFRNTSLLIGFIHVPYIPEQAHGESFSLPLERIAEGLQLCIRQLEAR